MTLVPSFVSSWMAMTGKEQDRAAVAAARIMPQTIVPQIDKHGVFFLRKWIRFSSLFFILCLEKATCQGWPPPYQGDNYPDVIRFNRTQPTKLLTIFDCSLDQ
jgi:hypothetical protein